MRMVEKKRKIVVINQAANYLTIGICNEFFEAFKDVTLITGSIHAQGEELHPEIKVVYINKWKEEHGFGKLMIYIKALWSFYYLLMTKYRKYEVFFISVPPMAYLLNLVLPHRFSMLIWDVYPDNLKITGIKESHPVYRFWSWLNRRSFKKAYAIITIGEKMADLLSKYVNREKLIIQPIWSIFQGNDKIKKSDNPFIKEQQLEGKFVVQYSGNIGLTHNVEVLIDIASAMKDHQHIVFHIIGRGPRKKQLEQRVRDEKIPNCRFLPFQSDTMFPYSLSAADLGVVILDETTSKGSVPSKSYNLMSYGIPSLYIAAEDSELAHYVFFYKHAACFKKNQTAQIIDYILTLSDNRRIYNQYSLNAVKASEDFKRENAKKIVIKYLDKFSED